DFAISRPTVVTACMFASSESGHPFGDRGTYVPVEEPSTASAADIRDDVNEKERPPLRRSLKGPRRSLCCFGFLNSLCGVADHVQHSLWLGEHWDVTGAQLNGCGAHALCDKALQFGLDGAIFSGHDVPTRLRPPSDTVDPLLEQVGHRCGLGRPHKLPLCLGQITRETSDTVRLL